MIRSLLVALGLLAAAPAHAGLLDARQTFTIGADVGAGGRWFDRVELGDRSAWGLVLGARAEVNAFVHVRADARYFEAKAFDRTDDRFFALSTAARTPKLFLFALDLHELYFRTSSRPSDDLLYAHTGLAVVGDLVGTIKGGLGFTYVGAPGFDDDKRTNAMGAYVGLEYTLRAKWLETSVRGTLFVAFDAGKAHLGFTGDADVMLKIPIKGLYLGPRAALSYRNLGITGPALFDQPHDVLGTVGLAVGWGTGSGKGTGRAPVKPAKGP